MKNVDMTVQDDRTKEDEMKITLKNNFHNSVARIIITGDKISLSQARRARRKLCGLADCVCSTGYLGERGPQDHGLEFSPREDGVLTVKKP